MFNLFIILFRFGTQTREQLNPFILIGLLADLDFLLKLRIVCQLNESSLEFSHYRVDFNKTHFVYKAICLLFQFIRSLIYQPLLRLYFQSLYIIVSEKKCYLKGVSELGFSYSIRRELNYLPLIEPKCT